MLLSCSHARPEQIGSQRRFRDSSTSRPLDSNSVLGRNSATVEPFMHSALANPACRRQFLLAAKRSDRLDDRLNDPIFVERVCVVRSHGYQCTSSPVYFQYQHGVDK